MRKNFNFSNLRLWLLIFIAFVKRNYLGLIVALIVTSLITIAQFRYNLFYNPNTITLGFIGTYQEHDLPTEVTKLISQSLLEQGEQGKIKSKLVSGWQTNNDATQFKFRLKDNIKWADGFTIKSQDLRVAIPNTELTYPDDKEIQFNLKESYSPLPSLLTKPILKRGSMMGTGPYKIKKIEKSRIFITKIELESEQQNLPKISIRFYPNESVAVTGFNLGEAQALFGFSSPKTFSSNPKVGLKQKVDYTKIVSILFNTANDSLSNRSLRQALSYQTPKMEGEQEANNPYPHFLWAYDPDAKKYLSNPEEAKAAIERAKSNLPEEKLKKEIILTVTPNLEGIGNIVINSWKELGLDVKLRVESGIAQNFQALLITQSIPLDPDQYFLWHATQTKTNLTKYDSKRVDKDLEDGRKIIIEEDRKAKYFDFQKTLLEDAPAVFLYFPKYNIAYLKKKEKLLDKILSL